MTTKRGRLTEARKRIVASGQKWSCGICSSTLPSAFEVDHRTPLWDGGVDDWENWWALCPNCHAAKTQKESIDRRERERLRSERHHIRRIARREAAIREELEPELNKCTDKTGVCFCVYCGKNSYSIFPHRTCSAMDRRIADMLTDEFKPKKKYHNTSAFTRRLMGGKLQPSATNKSVEEFALFIDRFRNTKQ